MSGRRTTRAAEAAASEASEAARVLAQRSHEARNEPAPEVEPVEPAVNQDRIEKALKGRASVQAHEEIARKRGQVVEEEPETQPEPKVEPKVEKAPEPEVQAEAPVVEAPVEPEAPKTVKVKVDGEEFEAPADEVEAAGGVKAYQMMRASENRLAKAAKIAEETRQAQAETAKMVQQLLAQQTPKKEEPTDEQFIKEKIDVIRFGTQEESAAALREILQRGAPKQIDQQALVQQATNAVANQQAVQRFKTEFADVVGNPNLWKLAQVLDAERRAELQPNASVDWDTFYRKIGNEIRSLVPSRQSQPPTTDQVKTAGTPSQPSEKEARKASITAIPTAAARAKAPEPEKELTPEETRAQWIKDAKKARGQG